MHIQLFAFGERETRSFHIKIALGIFSFFFFICDSISQRRRQQQQHQNKLSIHLFQAHTPRYYATRCRAVVIILSYFILLSSVHHAMVLLLNFCRPPAFLLCVFFPHPFVDQRKDSWHAVPFIQTRRRGDSRVFHLRWTWFYILYE